MKKIILTMASMSILSCGSDDDNEPQENKSYVVSKNTIVVNATSETEWTYLDLDSDASIVDIDNPDWDLAFQRYRIKLNSSSTPPTAAAIILSKLEDVSDIPNQDQFLVDQVTENAEEGLVFNGTDPWYDYDASNHILSPKENRSYVVYTTQHNVFGIAVMGYYDEFGTPANVSFIYKKL